MEIANEAPASFRSSARRLGAIGLIDEAVREILGRRRLIRYLVTAAVKKKGADSILGNVWWVLDPLLQMLVYLILLTVIFRRPTPDFPLFLFAAILPWKWFSSSISDAVGSVVKQERLIKQVQFPKIVLPTASVIAGVVNFAFGLIPLAAMLIFFYPAHASAMALLVPVIGVVQFVFTVGLSLIVSAVNVFYRDVGNLMSHVVRLWFYLSPTLWSFDRLDERGAVVKDVVGEFGYTLLHLNPFAILMTAYRDVLYGRIDETGRGFTPAQLPDFLALGLLLLFSVGLVLLGVFIFKRVEASFAKVL
jgi:ABC-type polysaccharide/polyol phosphate export permease